MPEDRRLDLDELIADYVRKLDQRLEELRPLVEEYREIQRQRAAVLGSKSGRSPGPNTSARRQPVSLRRRHIVEIVRAEPRVKISEVADRLGVTGQRIVQIVNGLEAEGLVARTEDGLVLGPKANDS